jgi:predicted DNA-binding protein (UPF0251 family)
MKDFREQWLCSLSDEEKSKLTHQDFSKSEIKEILDDIVLSPELREYADLLFIEGLNLSQSADKLQVNWQTAKSKYTYLRKIIIDYLCKQYKTKSVHLKTLSSAY